ncbi:MAG TPA: hypothetical protein VGB63_02595 [Pedobacter sp.]|jgi:hypothetical protein
MDNLLEINVDISAGKKTFKVEQENGGYTLMESGSIAAEIKRKDGKWVVTKGSYNEADAEIIGSLIEESRTTNNS